MAVVPIANVSTDQASGNISFTHGLTITAGDVIVAFVNANGTGNTVTDNNGSTAFTEQTHGDQPPAGSAVMYIFYRICGASEPSAYAFTLGSSDRSSIVLRQYRNVDSSIWDVAPSASNIGTDDSGGVTSTCPAITILTSGACGIVAMGDDFNPTTTTFSSIDNSYGNVQSESGQQYIVTADKTGLSTGTTGTTVITSGATVRTVQWQMALKPAATVTLEQEGFRFGVDDGSESAHGWEAAQDTNITTAAGVSKLLRFLVNATGDPAAIAFKLKYQKNGSGGYGTVPIGATGVGTTPVIEAGDTTSSGDNATTPTSPWAVTRPTAATGDLLIMIIGWDDSVNNTGISVANGPDGEVWSQIGSVVSSASTEARMTAYYVVATGSWGAGSISVTPNANEQWTATVIKVLAGEFDASTPIGASNTRASAGTAETSALSPSLTAGASDGGGRLIWAVTTDTDPLVTLQAGNTSIANNDRGNEALGVAIRDTAVTNSESIAGGATWSLAGDSWCSITFVVRAPIVNNDYYITTSANIAAGGEDTTARLTAPSAKSTSDFVTGRRWDNENGTDTTNITTDDYSEFEYFLTVRSGLSNADYFDSRIYNGDTALDTYTNTPRWTISAGLSATINQVTETDTAQALTKRKVKAVAQIAETDTAQAVTKRKVKAVAQVTETDTAQAVTKRKVKAVAQVTETDTAQAIAKRKVKTLGQTTETDTAQAVTKRKVQTLGQTTESDTAQPVSNLAGVVIGQVEELDTAQALARVKIKAVAQVSETDAAQPIQRLKLALIQQVNETDLAQAFFPLKRVAIVQVVEIDLAQALGRSKISVIGQVLETDLAQPVTAVGSTVVLRIISINSTVIEAVQVNSVVDELVSVNSTVREAAQVNSIVDELVSVNSAMQLLYEVNSEDVP